MIIESFYYMRSIISLLFFTITVNAQISIYQRVPSQVGVVFDIGSHENEIGIEWKSTYVWGISQWQVGGRLSFVQSSYGKRINFLDSRFFLGSSVLGGTKKPVGQHDMYITNLSNNSLYRNALGFSYLWYFDTKGTSQRSGAFGLTLDNWSLYFENDVFGGQSEDRYRTAHLMTTYRTEFCHFISGLNIWTGETRGTPWVKDKPEDCRHGYKDLTKLPYGKTSSGIYYIGVQYAFADGKFPLRTKIGLDSEEIRHIFQNRLTHDLCWLPKWAPHNTPHYPRLNAEGKPVFNSKERRKDLVFLQFSSGGIWSE
jgi:hypothetical protein